MFSSKLGKSMKKIIVFDLDGTLFCQDKKIDEETILKILSLQKNGIQVGIATGRFYNELDGIINELKLKEFGGFVLSSNGLEVHDFLNGKDKTFLKIDADQVKEFINISLRYHLIPYVYENGQYHMFGVHEFSLLQKMVSMIPSDFHYIKSVRELVLERDVDLHSLLYDKICFAGTPYHIQRFERFILKNYVGFRFYPVNAHCTELVHNEVGKLEATKYICSTRNRSLEDVLFFGDSGNDVDLLRECGLGVAMKNGMKETKKVADHISNFTNRHQGVLDMLNRFYPEEIGSKE